MARDKYFDEGDDIESQEEDYDEEDIESDEEIDFDDIADLIDEQERDCN